MDNTPSIIPKPKAKHPTKTNNKQRLFPRTPAPQVERTSDGRFIHGFPVSNTHDAGRARRALNLATINGMAAAFQRGGQRAIDLVMKNQPAMFLKMLVLLVPRELEVVHSGGVKAMTDEQLERALEAVEALMAQQRANGDSAIDVTPNATPADSESD